MADILLNFSSQWPSIQVAKVFANPRDTGETDTTPYVKKHRHGLGYPPLAVGMSLNGGTTSYDAMIGLDVDEQYVYIEPLAGNATDLQCAVVYTLDVSKDYDYSNYKSVVGDVITDNEASDVDLRHLLLHSRAVSPMVLSVKTKTYTMNDTGFTYTHQLDYPIFNFGYFHIVLTQGELRAGTWKNAPLAGQSWPFMTTDGYTSTLNTSITNQSLDANYNPIPGTGTLSADKGSIITLRNPAIITNNTVTVNI